MVVGQVKDTARFMLILLLITYAYAVASESLLQGEGNFRPWPDLYRLPHKAFWSLFGDLHLDEIKQGSAPLMVVPTLLGLYVVFSQLLLLNLLIARFSATHDRVEAEALQHQAWQRCQLLSEFRHRSPLPPPFNLLVLPVVLVYRLSNRAGRNSCRAHAQQQDAEAVASRGQARDAAREEKTEGVPLMGIREERSSQDEDGQHDDDSSESGDEEKEEKGEYESQIPHETSLRLTSDPATHGLRVTATWNGSFRECTVTMTNAYSVEEMQYTYPPEPGFNRLIIWKTTPSHIVTVKLSGRKPKLEKIDPANQEKYLYYKQLDIFEREQLESARIVDKK